MQKDQVNKRSSCKVAIFKLDTDDFEKYYNQRLIEHGCTIFPLSELYCQNLSRLKIKRLMSLDLKEFDIIVVFDTPKVIPFIRMKMDANAKLILWNWNKQSSMTAWKEKLVSPFCEIWTFDSNDAKKNNWKLNNQFYIPVTYTDDNSTPHRTRAFCACLDKGRYPAMKEIRKKLIENNAECDFTLVKDGSSNYASQDSVWIKENGMSYDVFLQHTLNSDVVIDLVQPGQSGLTVRTLEALFYNKKLITNNKSIQNYAFYSESNVLIVDGKNEEKITRFLKASMEDVDWKNKTPYTYEGWIQNFCSNDSVKEEVDK